MHEMLKWYLKIWDFVTNVDLDEVQALLLTCDEDEKLLRLFRILEKLDSLMKDLQDRLMHLADEQKQFDRKVPFSSQPAFPAIQLGGKPPIRVYHRKGPAERRDVALYREAEGHPAPS